MSILVYTDSTIQEVDLGTFGTIAVYKNSVNKVGELCSTNYSQGVNRDEVALIGVIEGLSLVNGIDINMQEPAIIVSTSKYICDAMNLGLVYGWIRQGWQVNNREIPNRELWLKLLSMIKNRNCKFKLVTQIRQDRLSKLDYYYLSSCRALCKRDSKITKQNNKLGVHSR